MTVRLVTHLIEERPLSTDTKDKAAKKKNKGKSVGVPEKLIGDLNGVFKMLSDKHRLKIVIALFKKGEMHVSALCDLVGQSQPAVSHHLTLMRMTGIVGFDRKGKNNFYYLNSEFLQALFEQFFASVGNKENVIEFSDFQLSYEPS